LNLIEYVNILWRRGWIMLLLAVIAAASAFFYSRSQPEVYRATQRVLMQPTRADFGLAEASKTLLGNHVLYLDSQFQAQKVIDTLNLDMTAADLKSRVTIADDSLSLSIQIDADMGSPGEAADVAREWGNLLIQYRNEENQRARREDHIRASLQDLPSISLYAPRTGITTIAGAILGLLVGAVIVFVLEYLESSVVHTRDDLDRSAAVPVLASIPHTEG
jgi:capsular polysaccharide biosynthesis protein